MYWFAWGAQIRVVFVHHWSQVKGIWCYGYSCLVIQRGSRWVRAMPVAPQQDNQPALSVTILAGHTAGHFSLVGPGLAISLRNCLTKSSFIWRPAIWAPNSDSASSLLQISTVLLHYDGYVHYLQALSTRLKLWFWVLSFIVLQDWSSFPAISFIFVR